MRYYTICSFILISIFSNISNAQESLEYKLASIDAGKTLPKNHLSVKRIKFLLDDLSYTYVENEQQIADMTVRAREILQGKYVNESLVNILSGMNSLFSKKVANQKYAEYIAAYMTLRMDGQSHYNAVANLDALLEVMGVD